MVEAFWREEFPVAVSVVSVSAEAVVVPRNVFPATVRFVVDAFVAVSDVVVKEVAVSALVVVVARFVVPETERAVEKRFVVDAF